MGTMKKRPKKSFLYSLYAKIFQQILYTLFTLPNKLETHCEKSTRDVSIQSLTNFGKFFVSFGKIPQKENPPSKTNNKGAKVAPNE